MENEMDSLDPNVDKGSVPELRNKGASANIKVALRIILCAKLKFKLTVYYVTSIHRFILNTVLTKL